MKTTITLALLFTLAKLSCLAQLPLLQVTAFDRAGTLAWTNRMRTAQPVYEVLRAHSVTGIWEHVAFVTNQTSVTLANPFADVAAPAFYRLAWVSDAPLDLDYALGEGYGFAAVTDASEEERVPPYLRSGVERAVPLAETVPKPSPTMLSQQQAHALAERLAAVEYGRLFGDAAFQNSRPPRFDSGRWTWLWRRGSGQSDIEIRVSFAPDGTSPFVDYLWLSSAAR